MAGETGNAPTLGPCSLFATWDQVTGCCNGLQAVEVEVQDTLLEAATFVVWGLTKGKYMGQCTKTMSPCQPACVIAGACGCPQRARFDLGSTPVWWAQVTVDGVNIPVTVEDFQYVVRSDAEWWPTCDNDWSIQWTYGWPIPPDISMATARLTCEFGKQCQGSDCALDPRTTSYTREGVSVQISDPNSMIANGKTGIAFVDMILFNPMHQRSGGIVDLAANVGSVTSWTL